MRKDITIAAKMENADIEAYRMALAVCVVAGVFQIIFGALKGGVLGDFFPSSAVHGLLASIGVIIMAKQIPVAFGVPGELLKDQHGHPLEPMALIFKLPSALTHFDPVLSIIGIVGLLIMFGLPAAIPKITKLMPTQLIVLIVTVPLTLFVLHVPHPALKLFGQEIMAPLPLTPPKDAAPKETPPADAPKVEHEKPTADHATDKEPAAPAPKPKPKGSPLVSVPLNVLGELKDRAMGLLSFKFFPNFEAMKYPAVFWKWVALFAIIGSLESLLSSKAVDMLDPWKRKTDLNRDLLAVGVANTAVAFFGGIPMISEIVRSRANIDNGAKSKFANLFHGMFLLASVVAIPAVLNQIPLAALASMLIFTGFRLAHPREFMHVYHIGREQLVVFVSTIIGVLATDLLIGIFIGMGVKLLIHFINGVPLVSLFRPFLKIEQVDDKTYLIKASESAVFSNWLLFRRQIFAYGYLQDKNIVVDLTDTKLVDHTVMEKLVDLKRDFESKGLKLDILGLDHHISLSGHPTSARLKGKGESAGHH